MRRTYARFSTTRLSILVLSAVVCAAAPIGAQTPTPAQAPPPQGNIRVTVPPVTVYAQKEPADKQKTPVSVTAVSADTIRDADIVIVSDAALYSPNTFFTEFTARKLSVARFRGIGSSPGNPAVTTFFDGVPQLNSNSASIDLLDVEQLEFVRGAQGALYGRNTIGGVINVMSARPSTGKWTGRLELPIANYDGVTFRGGASGGIVDDKLSGGVSFSSSNRDGYTVNTVTGNDIDSRSAFAIKGQLLWTPSSLWETRFIVSGERARDGDYALSDLASLRATPHTAAHDFEGSTDRDVVSVTAVATRKGTAMTLTSTTGLVSWNSADTTDLDYTPAPFITRVNDEDDVQFTQEIRLASAPQSTLSLGNTKLRWQAGGFFFTQNYDQDAVNSFAAGFAAPFAVDMHTPKASLDDVGLGLFGQGTLAFTERFDVTAGARFDYENKNGNLQTFFDPLIAPEIVMDLDDSFSRVSPQIAAAFRVNTEAMIYGSYGGGFKAGGFNPAAPAGFEAYGEEVTWLTEFGVKTTLANGRVTANAAVFHVKWDDLQLNVPDLTLPAQFYIANVGEATSKGVEFDVNARAAAGVDIFAAAGLTRARFGDTAVSNGVPVAGNKIANTPDYTFSLGTQITHSLTGSVTAYGRVEAVWYGAFQYDDMNTTQQDAYSLTHLRGGVRTQRFFVEGWMRNAFDTEYVPIAFPYPGFAQSGFIGEMGAPRTFGVTGGVRF